MFKPEDWYRIGADDNDCMVEENNNWTELRGDPFISSQHLDGWLLFPPGSF